MNRTPVDSVERLAAEIAAVRKAQEQYATFTQEQVDRIFFAAAVSVLSLVVLVHGISRQTSR